MKTIIGVVAELNGICQFVIERYTSLYVAQGNNLKQSIIA